MASELKVLIVDDQVGLMDKQEQGLWRTVIRSRLEKAGFPNAHVSICATISKAGEEICRANKTGHPYHIVVLDGKLPCDANDFASSSSSGSLYWSTEFIDRYIAPLAARPRVLPWTGVTRFHHIRDHCAEKGYDFLEDLCFKDVEDSGREKLAGCIAKVAKDNFAPGEVVLKPPAVRLAESTPS